MSTAPTLGDRIKGYEAVSRHKLLPNTPLFIRVDGRAFHTLTRSCGKPFDFNLVDVMTHAAMETAKEMQGFKLAYVQSDEATFMLSDFDRITSEGWFGYDLNKVVSLSAALFTAHFNAVSSLPLAVFDSRAFNVPAEDAPNVFVWRQRDWERNWVHMLARAHFSHKQLHGVTRQGAIDKLREVGVEPFDQPCVIKYGTYVMSDGTVRHFRPDYDELRDLMGRGGGDEGN